MMDICMGLHQIKNYSLIMLMFFMEKFITVLHPYQFAIDEESAKSIMEVYDYEWTDEEI